MKVHPAINRKIPLITLSICLAFGGGLAGQQVWAKQNYEDALGSLRTTYKSSSETTTKQKKTIKPTKKQNVKSQKSIDPLAQLLGNKSTNSTKQKSKTEQTATTKKSKNKRIRLFNTQESRSKIKKLPKWSGMLSKMKAWQGYLADPKTNNLKQRRKQWNTLKKSLASSSKMEKLKAVNKHFNKWPYKLDLNNYGKKDYWASPPEFLRRSGDCEDYAIAKFYALKELGFAGDTMRVVALKDTIRNIGHGILVVWLDGDAYVLDNVTNLIRSHEKYRHYRPHYSINEKYRWKHFPLKKK